MLALSDSRSVALTAATITHADKPVIKSPIAIFVGVVGSLPLRFKNPKIPTTTGVSNITQNGFTD